MKIGTFLYDGDMEDESRLFKDSLLHGSESERFD